MTNDYLNEYYDYMKSIEMSDNTITTYRFAINHFIQFMTEQYDQFEPEIILPMDIKDYRHYLLNVRRLKPTTIEKNLKALTSYCKYLVYLGVLKDNPFLQVSKFKYQRQVHSPEVLERTQFNKLKRAFYREENLRDICVFEVLYNTGVRVSELCQIQLEDIDLSARKGELIIRSGKGNKYRTVPLNAIVRTAITNYLAVRPKTGDQNLFQGSRGSLKRQAINKILNKYHGLANLGDVTIHPHKLRHQLGHDLLVNGESITVVQNVLGHVDINTTSRYTKPTQSETSESLERLC